MGNTVVVAEKPSVGRDIARVLGCKTAGEGCIRGNNYVVTWAVGHLVGLVEPDELDEKYKRWSFNTLPMLPEQIPLKVLKPTGKGPNQYKILTSLMNAADTDRIICATDAGREGELIFRYIYQKCKCKKPFFRLWINSMTDEAIADGFRHIKPGSAYDGLFRSAKCRSEADWLVGMNASRAYTLRYNALLSVGRVQTPTLGLLVKRRLEIENFRPEAFATLTAHFGDYQGVWFSDKCNPDTHLKDRASAEEIAREIHKQEGIVMAADTIRKQEPPPQLYDLTSLQRDASRLLGFTANKTLSLAQSLYEKHKALTYPRTDSRYLPPDMVPKVVETMKVLPASYQPFVAGALPGGKLPVSKRTIDVEKVTDHHALIPTTKRVNPASFSEDERQLYDLVARRMLAAFYPACEYLSTKVITQVKSHRFRTTGKVIVTNGWHDVPVLENPPKARKKAQAKPEDTVLPPLQKGDRRLVESASVKEDMTKPPQQLSDDTLLSAMENAGKESDDQEIVRQMKGSGIGTPATRASIIERLIAVGYVTRQNKTQLVATDKGVKLIEVMPPEIVSAETTGRWELALDRITGGQQDAEKFMESIRKFSAFLVENAKTADTKVQFPEEAVRGRKGGAKTRQTFVPNCLCPLCKKGKVVESPQAFSCEQRASGCHFTLWKDCLTKGGGPMLTAKLLPLILERKTVTGSTGAIQLTEQTIAFYPPNASFPSISRGLTYVKK